MSIVNEILACTNPHLLFGTDKDTARQKYRRLERQVHPDLFADDQDKNSASRAFAHLNVLWSQYHAFSSREKNARKITTRHGEYLITSFQGSDEVFDYSTVTHDGGHQCAQMLISRAVSDADLVASYASALKALRDVPENYRVFFPQVVESFRYVQDDGAHAGLILENLEGFFTLRQVLRRYPQGICGRDVAWMFRRMLVAVGNGHDVGLVHGAPTLDAFSVHPELHGLVLHSWQYSRKSGESLLAVPSNFKSAYPKAALDKKNVNYALDIHIMADTARRLLRTDAPAPLFAFLKGCQLSSVPSAAQLLAEFDDLLLRIYGKPKFHVFSMK